ncbi:energy-coupling factor transporter transmembrane component T family protein [Pseudoclavibacter sp. 13-3]|uniref:energy-coupling factor transporter transmembrane component T family protein n=1 Tax=Pseudoclavibacter sp. 13-3 TaxID=2901228 RepID=UPI001E3F81B3|nr:energy-coupling factor transporter transmembrane protein EcfT [Pseudoclavibacter sp. 13-3]
MISQYVPGDSPMHRLPAGPKLLLLMTIALVVSLLPAVWWVSAGLLVVTPALYALAGPVLRELPRQLWTTKWVIVFFGLLILIFQGPMPALVQTTRFISLIVLAGLVTLTTTTTAMLDALTRAMGPLRLVGIAPERVALTLSLAISAVPVVSGLSHSIREAQIARGTPPSIRAYVLPLLVMTLKYSDDLADALTARGVE